LLNKYLYTFLQPNKSASESSVTVPSTKPFYSKNAHCASASNGAWTYGIPNSFSNPIINSVL